jgi:hypothetical protein
MRFIPAGLAGLLLTVAAAAQAGGLANGNFESGNLGGWFSSGSTAIASGNAGYAPLAGSHSALVVAVSTAPVPPYSCAVDLWNINCPQPLPFAASGAPLPTHTNFQGVGVGFAFFRGAFIGTDVAVNAGDTLSWTWQPGGEAAGGLFSIDEARFYATNGIVETRIDFDQGLQSFTFGSAGTWSVYFGLYQTEDPFGYSTVLLDNILLSAVPEPSGAALLGLGLLALSARRRRRAGVRFAFTRASK